jgi:hypothetical protein
VTDEGGRWSATAGTTIGDRADCWQSVDPKVRARPTDRGLEKTLRKTIEHFMWGFQGHFRGNQEVDAKAIFRVLDERFDPEVFLVGVLVENRAGCQPACVEPEDDFWIPSEAFDGVVKAAQPLPRSYPESRGWHSDPRVQESETERLWRRAVHETIGKVIAEHPARPAGMLYFASFPVRRDAYLVSTVLGLQEDVVSSYASLDGGRARIHEYGSFKLAVSLIDATVDEFLNNAARELERPDAGEGWGSARTPGEVIRSAGARFTMDCAYRADRDSELTGYWQRVFDACNAVASLKYERAAGSGRFVVARREHPAVKRAISFSKPVSVHNARGARKLLELSSRGLALHVNARFIFGLVEVDDYAAEQEDLFEIEVLDHHHWKLVHARHTLMHVDSGQPRLLSRPFNAAKLRTDLGRIFDQLSPDDADRLVALVKAAVTEKHGTMLVIVADAPQEAQRLANQATVIEPCSATGKLIEHVTPIDGAVLLGPDCVCHAIGVILDGLATPYGDPSRGARFNSALRYVWAHQPCLAIVVSEDGGVDLIPDLRPTIRRSEIEREISELQAIASEPKVRRRRFKDLVDWIKRHEFYLLPEHCAKVNELIGVIDAHLVQEDPSDWRIVRDDFRPVAGFDPSFYYASE